MMCRTWRALMMGSRRSSACRPGTTPAGTEFRSVAPPPRKDIVDTAASSGIFHTLIAALNAAGLTSTLKGPGPFTVFAPTGEAFARLPAGTLDELLKPDNRDKLAAVLNNHVIAGQVPSAKAIALDSVKTVGGQSVPLRVYDGALIAGPSKVVQADIQASNGIIHIVDTVILPA